jgi:hypothetical protein
MVAFIGGCTSEAETVTRQADSGSVTNVVDEARAFMADYGRDLLAGDRGAIAARYDRTGAYSLGNGRKQFSPYDALLPIRRAANLSTHRSFAAKPSMGAQWGVRTRGV